MFATEITRLANDHVVLSGLRLFILLGERLLRSLFGLAHPNMGMLQAVPADIKPGSLIGWFMGVGGVVASAMMMVAAALATLDESHYLLTCSQEMSVTNYYE